jgi:hypothetical protein
MAFQRSTRRKGALRVAALCTAGVLATALLPGQVAFAQPGASCEKRNNNTYEKLLECVTGEGVTEHLEAFQKIADNSTDPVYPGTRAAGTDGYADSVEYVAGLLRKARYRVTLDPVEITFNFPAELRQLTPAEAEYESGVFTGSGNGEVQGNVIPVDINLEGDRASTSGCEAADFGGLDFSGENDIALVQRGTCFFGTKAYYAEQAGAEAVIVFNQGNSPDREGLIVADATSVDEGVPGAPGPITHGIPVVGASFADGVALAVEGSTAFVKVLPAETRTDYNVIAELPARTRTTSSWPARTSTASSRAGASTTTAPAPPRSSRRRCCWRTPTRRTPCASPGGPPRSRALVGSADYVAGLSQAERERIAVYMNYDMVGSPNYFFGVYTPTSRRARTGSRFRLVHGHRGRLRVLHTCR